MEGDDHRRVGRRAHLTMDNELTIYDKGTKETEDPVENSRVDGLLVLRPSLPILPSKIDRAAVQSDLGHRRRDSELVYELFPQIQYQITEYRRAFGLSHRRLQDQGRAQRRQRGEYPHGRLLLGIGVTF
jgi:hypothetical protein